MHMLQRLFPIRDPEAGQEVLPETRLARVRVRAESARELYVDIYPVGCNVVARAQKLCVQSLVATNSVFLQRQL